MPLISEAFAQVTVQARARPTNKTRATTACPSMTNRLTDRKCNIITCALFVKFLNNLNAYIARIKAMNPNT